MNHSIAELYGKAQYLRPVFRKAPSADPATQVTAADVFQQQIGLTLKFLHNARLGDVLVNIKIDPCVSLLREEIGYGRSASKDLILKTLGSKHFVQFMIVNNVENTHSATKDFMNLPTILYSVAYLPVRCDRLPPRKDALLHQC